MENKVLIYSQSHGVWGGGQIYIEQLCNFMHSKNTACYILTSEPDVFGCPTKKMENVSSRKKRFLSAFTLARNYKKQGFNTIILNDLASMWLALVFKIFGFRVIALLHLYLRKKEGESLGHTLPEYYLLKLSAYFCDRILSVNKDNQKAFGKKVEFIGNYVPKWFFETPKREEKANYDFILIARFSIEKNILLFIDLLERINRYSEKTYHALLVGDGPLKEEIKAAIAAKGLEGCVTIEGWVKRQELPQVYDRGKCFVISSYHEGFATTLLEAHARGIPAIVTRSSGFCGEFVEDYGAPTGLVFEPKDLDSDPFYDRLEVLIENYQSYGLKCLEKAKLFSEENVLEPILQAAIGEN